MKKFTMNIRINRFSKRFIFATLVASAMAFPACKEANSQEEFLQKKIAPQIEEIQPEEIQASGSCLKIASWNIANLGQSKDASEINVMAQSLKDFDIVAIQEVVASAPGPQAVSKLDDALDRTGAKWDYIISNETGGTGTERYAYLFKTSKVSIVGKASLSADLAYSIDREPFLCEFKSAQGNFFLASLHAVPASKFPETEIQQLHILDEKFEDKNLLIMGDFNCIHSNTAFNNLRSRGMKETFFSEKTTLKMKPNAQGEYKANCFDNIWYEADEMTVGQKGVVDFTSCCVDVATARKISDHLPVWACFTLK
jgi:deoxyribonuclease-1-like protein